ncbi:MAG: hypothetical protein RL173_2856 [Fibrobacterota bacterium]
MEWLESCWRSWIRVSDLTNSESNSMIFQRSVLGVYLASALVCADDVAIEADASMPTGWPKAQNRGDTVKVEVLPSVQLLNEKRDKEGGSIGKLVEPLAFAATGTMLAYFGIYYWRHHSEMNAQAQRNNVNPIGLGFVATISIPVGCGLVALGVSELF